MLEEKELRATLGQFFQKREHQIGLLAVITVLALVCAFWNAADTRSELEHNSQEYCEVITAQMRDAFQSGINAKMIDLINVADSLSRIFDGSNPAAAEEFLARKADILEFDGLFLLSGEAGCIAHTAGRSLTLGEAEVEAQLARTPALWQETHMGFIEGQTLFYSAPVELDGAAAYALVGVRSKETMQRIITSGAFEGQTLSCVIDSHGNVVLSATEIKPFADLESIFESQAGGSGAGLVQMEADLAAGRAGSLRFTSITGRENLLAYNPLQNNEWFLLTIVPASLMAGNISAYFMRTLLVVLGLALVFLLFLLMLYRLNADGQKQLLHLAYQDGITGGRNNAAFQRQYRKALRDRRPAQASVVVLNVRHFKLLNEKFGFGAGNHILCVIGQELENGMDPAQGEFSARSEMDNFFLCLAGQDKLCIQARVQAMEAAINTRLRQTYPGARLNFTAGCCIVEDPAMDIRILQDRARIAARDEAVKSPDGCAFYSDGIAERILWEQELEALFEDALASRGFEVYLQPKVGLGSGRLNGAEALVRWRHPERGMIPPGDFIPLLERSGKICALDFYVFEAVCRFYQHRRAQGLPWYPVSVNLSRYHFFEDGFLEPFDAVRRSYGLPDGAVEFELTESMFFDHEHNERIQKGIAQMHALGFACSMDDFGAGYSSLGILKEFDVDTIKMDRSFFLDMDSEKARDIIRSVVELAAKLHLETVAEGIEQSGQIEFLREIRCDTVQGYYFSRPLPLEEFERWAGDYEAAHAAKAEAN